MWLTHIFIFKINYYYVAPTRFALKPTQTTVINSELVNPLVVYGFANKSCSSMLFALSFKYPWAVIMQHANVMRHSSTAQYNINDYE